MPHSNLKSKRVLITGAGAGIGYQLALAFARQGAHIIATDMTEEGLAKLSHEVEALKVTCRTELLNVTSAEAFNTLAEQLITDNEIPDILVNNAGIGISKSIMDTETDDWDTQFNVNVKGSHNGIKTFVGLWLEKGIAGQLVNITSSAAFAPLANMGAYAASKAAAYAMTEALAQELSHTNIVITNVCPGAINTKITHGKSGLSAEATARVQKYYLEEGTDPAVMAATIVNGVDKKKSVVIFGAGAGGADFGRRFLTHRAYRNTLTNAARRLGFLPAKSP